jgi:glycosyltransferase involved in cell wall biosynthesis
VKIKFSRDLLLDLPHARVFVYITRQEGLGSAALLAMAHSVPVLASRVGGLPEIVIDGRTGVLTENDPTEIREKLEMLLANTDEAHRLGQQGRELVLSRYTLEHMVDATEAAYQELACS